MASNGRGADCFLQGAGCRTDHAQACTTRRPPLVCDVRADWLRVCGGCYLRLGRGDDPDLMAAVRGDAHVATPFVSRKRPRRGETGEAEADLIAENEEDIRKESDAFRGFVPGVTRVYGEGALFPTLPAGVKMLIAGAHETLKKMTEKGGGGQPDICVGDAYARKAKQKKGRVGSR